MDQYTVMVVEDEPLIGMELQETLERLGYRVPSVIDSADNLLTAFNREKPDLILMDIRLRSYLDGIDVAHRLRLISDVPMIYLSAYTNEETIARAEKTGPVAVLAKPVDESVLAEHVGRALRGR